ncbi:hypothetical protein [Bacteriovorax sp. Seq25_V]|uniref:hypothetical protein n=1 Tax=Bacteriovorax sp. Seq25_V TaxID=1201288 RepID=UPI00038A4F0F|nr:hypothetical protein [Bacteriovorax sp. Seq25_V]EQC47969.1 hypothetical protein M900_A0075 [Bacteriovorax sp. Seq25_V]
MNKKVLIPSLVILIIGVVLYYFYTSEQHLGQQSPTTLTFEEKQIKRKEIMMPKEHQSGESLACERAYRKLGAGKLRTKSDLRFINKHFEYEGEVYRTRFFYDDGAEGDVPTYLVYKEDSDQFPVIIESSKYQPGKQFAFFNKNINVFLFTESGINQTLDSENEIFTHYENEKLIEIISTNLNCKFNN